MLVCLSVISGMLMEEHYLPKLLTSPYLLFLVFSTAMVVVSNSIAHSALIYHRRTHQAWIPESSGRISVSVSVLLHHQPPVGVRRWFPYIA